MNNPKYTFCENFILNIHKKLIVTSSVHKTIEHSLSVYYFFHQFSIIITSDKQYRNEKTNMFNNLMLPL